MAWPLAGASSSIGSSVVPPTRGGEIGDGQVEAQVRFVGAVAGDGVGVGQAGKRSLDAAWSSVP